MFSSELIFIKCDSFAFKTVLNETSKMSKIHVHYYTVYMINPLNLNSRNVEEKLYFSKIPRKIINLYQRTNSNNEDFIIYF